MPEKNSLRAIQQRTMQLMNFEDGLWDIMLGMIFLALACYPLTRAALGPVWNLGLFLVVLLVLVLAWFGVRRVVSAPRIGHARPRRSPKLRFLLIITAVMVALTLGLVALTLFSPRTVTRAVGETAASGRSYLVEWIVVIAIGLVFSGLGYIAGVTRLYFYGWMLGLANLASVYMEHKAGWTFMLPLAIAAGIILLIGVILFTRFIQRYPSRAGAA
ncbi:MAG: hypothetical protein PVF85_13085 [Anaerolineales bacterium]|jgi:hypothetical protein